LPFAAREGGLDVMLRHFLDLVHQAVFLQIVLLSVASAKPIVPPKEVSDALAGCPSGQEFWISVPFNPGVPNQHVPVYQNGPKVLRLTYFNVNPLPQWWILDVLGRDVQNKYQSADGKPFQTSVTDPNKPPIPIRANSQITLDRKQSGPGYEVTSVTLAGCLEP
jgi:hypothetical protein